MGDDDMGSALLLDDVGGDDAAAAILARGDGVTTDGDDDVGDGGDDAAASDDTVVTVDDVPSGTADDDDGPCCACPPSPRAVALACVRVLGLLTALYIFFFALSLMSESFTILGGGLTRAIERLTTNPLAGLIAGVLVTVLLQSSSTTTSIIVALVGSGDLAVRNAVPMVMGSNIGTSITNTLVAVAHIKSRKEFERAFAGATVHDFFNLLSVAVLLPVEVLTGYLEFVSGKVAGAAAGGDGDDMMMDGGGGGAGGDGGGGEDSIPNPVKYVVSPAVHLVLQVDKEAVRNETFTGSAVKGGMFYGSGLSNAAVGAISLTLCIVVLVFALWLLVRVLKSVLKGRVRKVLIKVVDFNGYVSMLIGAVITAAVQSSSITTSTLVPLVGIGVVTLEQMFPLTLGANLGTTGTAFLASITADKSTGVQIAFVHLMFNLTGILLWYPIPHVRRVPIWLARQLGLQSARRRWVALAYVATVFCVVPLALLGLSYLGPAWLYSVVSLMTVAAVVTIAYETVRRMRPLWLPRRMRTWRWLPCVPAPAAPACWCTSPYWCPAFCRGVPEPGDYAGA